MTTSTASTTPARTVREINASLVFIRECLDALDQRLHDLRNEPAKGNVWVVGYTTSSLYLNPRGGFDEVLRARLFDAFNAARVAGRMFSNVRGESPSPIRYERALDIAIDQLEGAHTALCGALYDASVELLEAQAYERHLDDAAEAERVLADYRLDQRL
jgi:hypothetical protein